MTSRQFGSGLTYIQLGLQRRSGASTFQRRRHSIRNETLAHNAEEPSAQKAKYGYADDLLEKTIPIAEAINIIARSHGFHGKDFIEAWATRADHFWTAAIKGVPE